MADDKTTEQNEAAPETAAEQPAQPAQPKPDEAPAAAAGVGKTDTAKPDAGGAGEGGKAGDAPDAEAEAPKRARVRGAKAVPLGVAHVRATFNNTIVSITDPSGAVIAWSSAGRAGFKGSRKSTSFAATVVGQEAARQAVARGMHEIEVRVHGAGSGRESAVRALQSSGLTVTLIKDVTPIPHNGCRARKRRRV
jgi:small subunit ribosomal protein S11